MPKVAEPFPSLEEMNSSLVPLLARVRKHAYLNSPRPGGLALCHILDEGAQVSAVLLISGTQCYAADRVMVDAISDVLSDLVSELYGPRGRSVHWSSSEPLP